jgi:hypothetical protein
MYRLPFVWCGALAAGAVLVCAVPAAGQDAAAEKHGARWVNLSPRARQELQSDAAQLRAVAAAGATAPGAAGRGAAGTPDAAAMKTAAAGDAGQSVGRTFVRTPLSRDHDVDRLTRTVVRERLSRTLFGATGATASYYRASYRKSAPFVSATYIQLVADPVWNRIVYGNLDRWIKAYDDVVGPSAIAVSPDGKFFVGETGRERIAVFRIDGDGDAAELRPAFEIANVANPADIAYLDGGTPFDAADDELLVADPTRNRVVRYRLGPASASEAAAYDGFEGPTALAAGRWNGATTGTVYVVDKLGKRLRRFELGASALTFLGGRESDHRQYIASVKTDHFGNVYASDATASRVVKFTAALEELDAEEGPEGLESPRALDIPFGRISVEGEGDYWAGFDQLFGVERWAAASGAQRRTLGLAMKNIAHGLEDDGAALRTHFVLTDAGRIDATVLDAVGGVVRHLASSWMVPGRRDLQWDRRGDDGRQVPPGDYVIELSGTSPYREEVVTAAARMRLPLFYDERSGSGNAADDPHVVQGMPRRWGQQGEFSANEHSSAVQYRFAGLNPESEYFVAVDYIAPDGVPRTQDLTAGGVRVHDALAVTAAGSSLDYMRLPASAYADGELLLSVNRRGDGSAVVSRVRLKEGASAFAVEPVTAQVPAAYDLAQNYPNPFNPSTTIRYQIPAAARVTLKVYDTAGREVATLVNGQQGAGTYDVRFDATGLSSGVYFYQLRSGDFTRTSKMVLVK